MNAFFIVCAIAALAAVPTGHVQAVIAGAASTLFESIPFILAGSFARRLVPRCGDTLSALTSCGCAQGPGARSLAVTALTLVTFGPPIAVARFIAASIAARVLPHRPHTSNGSVLSEAAALLPCAFGAGIFAAFIGNLVQLHLGALTAVAIGLTLGFFAPCTLGAIALAAMLRHFSMPAAIAMLAVTGLWDLRSLGTARSSRPSHDAFAYSIGAAACAWLAYAHGAALLNPRFTFALWLSCCALAVLAWVHRRERNARLRWAPLLMVAGAAFSHALPSYSITETTLSDAAPGDTIDFHGVLARRGKEDALVRYAITCCRADAQPVVVRLDHPLRERTGAWLAARGTLVGEPFGLALRIRSYRRIDAPTDPFIYR